MKGDINSLTHCKKKTLEDVLVNIYIYIYKAEVAYFRGLQGRQGQASF